MFAVTTARLVRLVAVLALAVGLLAPAALASAAPAQDTLAALDPATLVSNDGTVTPLAARDRVLAQAGVLGQTLSEPAEGSGDLTGLTAGEVDADQQPGLPGLSGLSLPLPSLVPSIIGADNRSGDQPESGVHRTGSSTVPQTTESPRSPQRRGGTAADRVPRKRDQGRTFARRTTGDPGRYRRRARGRPRCRGRRQPAF